VVSGGISLPSAHDLGPVCIAPIRQHKRFPMVKP
jgi:hypothetical protein